MKHFLMIALALVGLAFLAAACDEALPIKGDLPNESNKVYIPPFENKTSEPGLDTLLTQKVIQNFLIDGRLQVADEDKADMILEGTIERYDRLVMTRDQNQVPQQYRLQVVVDLTLYSSKPRKKELWTTHTIVNLTPGESMTGDEFDSTNVTSLREFTTYYVLNVAGVPPEDEPTAQARLMDQMAGRVVRRTIDGF